MNRKAIILCFASFNLGACVGWFAQPAPKLPGNERRSNTAADLKEEIHLLRELNKLQEKELAEIKAVIAEPPSRKDGAEDPVLTFDNDIGTRIGVWVRSEKDTEPNPRGMQFVEPRKQGRFALHFPDRYTIVVEAYGQRSRSKPVALKAFLTKNPGSVMRVNATTVSGYSSEGGSAEIKGSVAPSETDGRMPAVAKRDVLQLEFRPERDEAEKNPSSEQ